jgi:two-component system cell cycle sensor histidine kinase/response regulator CckA
MTDKDSRPDQADELRRRAEAIAGETAAQPPADLAALSPEDTRWTLHELQVHQIELEMQNEELRRTQGELEASRARYFDLYDLAPVGYCTLSEEGLILEANLSAAALLGVDRGALVTQPISRFVLPEDQDIYYLHRMKLFKTGEPQVCELRLLRRDGTPIWAHLEATAAQDAGGAPVCRVVLSDVTERRQAEEALRESKEQLACAIEGSGVGLWDWDIEANEVVRNERWANMLGYALAELSPASLDSWARLCHPDDLLGSDELVMRHLAGESPIYECEARMRHKDGHWVWVLDRGKVTERDGEGRPIRMTGTHLDITDRKHAEEERLALERRLQQSQKLESLGVLAGGIAHDFNNILTAVLGNADLALSELPPFGPAREYLLEITQASRRAAELCRQMLAYSGRGHFVIEPIDLGALVEDMLHLLESTISKKALLTLNLESTLPPLLGDPSQLSQVIMNLVINASEAIGEKGGVTTISTGVLECSQEYLRDAYLEPNLSPGLYVTLGISDTGCGMDAGTQERIFEPFFTTKFTGRGLGLAAVLGIVRGHKGALKVHSEPDRGTTFTLLFPAAKTEPLPHVRTHAPQADGWQGGGTILLVDDEETILTVGTHMLERLGFQVLTAADGREALNVYYTHMDRITLVLLDLTMPRMDGGETFHELRCLNPDVRVVMSSGYTEQDVTSRFAGEGLVGFVPKPYTIDELRTRLWAALTDD